MIKRAWSVIAPSSSLAERHVGQNVDRSAGEGASLG
jgi:hypothetical protein